MVSDLVSLLKEDLIRSDAEVAGVHLVENMGKHRLFDAVSRLRLSLEM
jgi:hypothetical protein